MTAQRPLGPTLEATFRQVLLATDDRFVLAVSGGRDSMALLHAFALWAPDRVAAVATFDHATGRYATEAASLVMAEGRKRGFVVTRETATRVGRNEAEWRDARWRFLRRVSNAYRARIATAHTRDDQVETIVMRVLRDSGARGLAALAASSPILRPWLDVGRDDVAFWAAQHDVRFLDDPTNASRRFLRSRLRHDLLPALERAHPGFSAEMLALGSQAARWRRDVDAFLDRCELETIGPRALRAPVGPLLATSDAGRAVLWQALFARLGVALDAHGTRALVRFTNCGRRGASVSVAGGAVVLRHGAGDREWFELRRPAPAFAWTEWQGPWGQQPVRAGQWRWRRFTPTSAAETADASCYALPATAHVVVRPWRDGDRIRSAGAQAGRRVARYFSDRHVPALDRQGWPVVILVDELVWIPGISRGIAAPHWPGRPDLIWYRCERQHD